MRRAVVKALAWLALTIPGALMLRDVWSGEALAMDLLGPSGTWSVRLMILAMLPGPLADAFGAHALLRGWLMLRRNLGVAAFGYALLHLVLYAADMAPAAMLDELTLPGIWTGWLALALLIPPAIVSSDAAVRALGRAWSLIQRLVYPALILAAAHWLLLAWSWLPAVLHLTPLGLVWLLRLRQRGVIPLYRSAS